MTVRLNWRNRVVGTSILIYRADATFDANTLPPSIASVSGDATSYDDATVVAGQTYFYAIGTAEGARVALSAVVEVQAAADGGEDPVVVGQFLGATVSRALPYTFDPLLDVTWQQADYDPLGFWSFGFPGRLTVPAGVSIVRLNAFVQFNDAAVQSTLFMQLLKNGAAFPGQFMVNHRVLATPAEWPSNTIDGYSAAIPVVEGDYFSLRVDASSASITDLLTTTQFNLEVLQ